MYTQTKILLENGAVLEIIDDRVLCSDAAHQSIHLTPAAECILKVLAENVNTRVTSPALYAAYTNESPDCALKDVGQYVSKVIYTFPPPIRACIDNARGKGYLLRGQKLPTQIRQPQPDLRNIHGSLDYTLHTNCPQPDLIAERINGYADEVAAVRRQLSRQNNKAALVGMGGVGKSELAKAIAASCADLFPTRLWVNFSNSLMETLGNDNTFSIWGCNREDHLKDTDRQYFDRKLRILKSIAGRQVLLIIDGFDVSEDPDLSSLLSGEYAVLITTRNIPTAGSLPTFMISHFRDEAKQMALFQQKYKRHIDPSEMDDILTMIRAWQGHTLGICMLASTMREKRIRPGEMRAMLYDDPGRAAGHPLADSIQKEFHRIFDPSHFSPSEWYVLQNLALIPESGISIEEFCQWTETEDYGVINALIDRSFVIHDSYSDSVHLHSIITGLILPTLSDPACCARFISNLTTACANAFNCNYLRKLELYEFCQTAYDRTAHWPQIQLNLSIHLGELLRLLGKCEESADHFIRLRHMTDSITTRIWLDSKISHALLLGGEFDEGSRIALEGYQAFLKLPPEQLDHRTRRAGNWLLQRLCEYYRWTGDAEAAVRYGNAAVDLLPDHGTDADWDKGWSKYHLGYAYLHLRQIDRSMQELNDALALFDRVGSAYSAGFTMELLGLAYMVTGDYPRALEMTVTAGKRIGNLLAPGHPDCGRNWLCQGNVYRLMGNEPKALRCFRNSITAFRGTSDQKADLVAALLENNEIILDIWREQYKLEHP